MAQIDLSERLSQTRIRLECQRAGETELRAKFLRLERKETRVREDQYSALSNLARTLMRDRVARRERITENTLIRVAIDLLLAHRDQLRGSDEDELRRSVLTGLPNTRSSEVSASGAQELRKSQSHGVADSAVQESEGPNSETPEVSKSRSGPR